jgi:hypothetical protein
MTDEHYKLALDKAREELTGLLTQRQEIDRRIMNVQRSIEGLAALCDESTDISDVLSSISHIEVSPMVGLTAAIREILKGARKPLAPTEVRDELTRMGFDVEKYKQEMVPIHNTLKRLEENVEIFPVKNAEGKTIAYKWIQPEARILALNASPNTFPPGHEMNYIITKLREKK